MPRKKKEMPIQKSDSFTAGKPEPVVEAAPEPVAEVETLVLCGHVNRHYTGKEEMACELPKGHAGNHKKGTGTDEWKDEAGYAINK